MIYFLTSDLAVGLVVILAMWSTYRNMDVVATTVSDRLMELGKTSRDITYLIPLFAYTTGICFLTFIVVWAIPVSIIWLIFGV